MRQIGTHDVEPCKEIPIVTQNGQRDAEPGHDAEVVLFGVVLKKCLQHGEREDQRRQRKKQSP